LATKPKPNWLSTSMHRSDSNRAESAGWKE
jgi:hypothetical protein